MSEQPDAIRTSVAERFTGTTNDPSQEKTFPVGPESAKRLSYDAAEIDVLGASVTESFCGVGNPFLSAVRLPTETEASLYRRGER